MSLVFLFFLAICRTLGNTYQVIDNNTLIYNHDKYHNIDYYCHFAPVETIKSLSIEIACLRRNNGMQHILANGIKTVPYIAQGHPKGFILECEDIPRGKLSSGCSRYVHSSCYYTCGDNTIHTIKCNLIGPWNNVTAQWSDQDPCPQPVVKSLSEGDTPDNMVIVYIAVPTTVGFLIVVIIIGVYIWKKICCRIRNDLVHVVSLNARSLEEDQEGNSPDESKISPQQPLLETSNLQGKISPQQPLLETSNLQGGLAQNIATDTRVLDEGQDANSPSEENNERDQQQAVRHDINNPQTGLPELNRNSFCDYSYNRDDMNKSKAIGDKDMEFPLCGFISMNLASVENIKVEYSSATDMFSNGPENEKLLPVSACSDSVKLLEKQTRSYRKRLRPELEVIRGRRSRGQALVGYIEENAQELGVTYSEINMYEMTFETKIDEKVSDYFLQKLAEAEIKIGSIVQYFNNHNNYNAVSIILEVHNDCEFCEQFRRL